MVDRATSCNSTLNLAIANPNGSDQSTRRCDQPAGHWTNHGDAETAPDGEGLFWVDSAVGVKAHQVRHVPDSQDPDYLNELLHTAWGVIANAGLHHGGWSHEDPEWVAAAERWRDEYHSVCVAPVPEKATS